MAALFKTTSWCSAEGLPGVSKCKKDVMCLLEEIHVLDKSHSGVSSSTVDHKFNVNETTTYK